MSSLTVSGDAPGESPDSTRSAHWADLHPVWIETTSQATLRYFGNELLEIRFAAGSRFKLSNATEITRACVEHAGSKISYMLFDISGLDDLDMGLSSYFDEVAEGIPVALVGTGPADQVLARFFMRKIDPLHRCLYVESRAAALKFLARHD